MKKTATAALLAITMLALQGCASDSSETPAPTVTVTVEATAPAPAENETAAPEPSEVPTTPAAPSELVTLAYEDSYKSIFLLDRAQVSAATGIELTADTQQQVADALANADLWNADTRTAAYSTLITAAVTRESGSTRDALQALLNNPTARLKVYVSHNQHKEIAHIQISNEGDDHDGDDD